MPRAAGPLMHNTFAHAFQQRANRVHNGGIASHHDGEGRVAGANIATAYRGIQRMNTFRFRRCFDLHSQRRFASGHVHQNGTRGRTGQCSMVPQQDFAHISRKTDNGENHIRLRRNFTRAGGPCCSLGDKIFSFLAGTAVDSGLISLSEKVAAHRAAHDPRSNPANSGCAGCCRLHEKTPECHRCQPKFRLGLIGSKATGPLMLLLQIIFNNSSWFVLRD